MNDLWKKVSEPPEWALKKIGGGRLKGMTDINPQWRYTAMTEVYGMCGVGWKYTIDKLWLEKADDKQTVAFAQISLYTKSPEGWSDAIPGTGGSLFVANESNGLRASDEAYKMAITDALSVAMKMIGVGAAIYQGRWDGAKYHQIPEEARAPALPQKPVEPPPPPPTTKDVNLSLSGKITAVQYDTLTASLKKQVITRKQWVVWLSSCYHCASAMEIPAEAYIGILDMIENYPDRIKNFKAEQRQPGEEG